MIDSDMEVKIDHEIYKTLLESTKAIPWKIDWASKEFSYIGPQIERLLGWSQSSWLSAYDWADRMHADDREATFNYCVSQSEAGIDHEVDYRALTKDGNYVWIRDVMHVIRGPNGETESLIGFMFDISDRKKDEEELIRLHAELEEHSFKDNLTGLANRRMFNLKLENEWVRAQRSLQPLSLIILDIDFFKQYNDHYGNIQGDECLHRVGQALRLAPIRSSDLVARYGGEEFVLLLPETDAESALQVAEKCRSLITQQQIQHEKSAISHNITISLGVGTIIPSPNIEPIQFIDMVDKLLYKAKANGRNCIESAV